jgi:hypothetical protein
MEQYHPPLLFCPKSCPPPLSLSFSMVAISPTPSFPGAWPDLSSSDLVPPLPDKPIPQHNPENDETSQDLSPSLVCLSPRPVPELPSLSSSLSTAESTVTSRSPTPPEQSASPVEEQPTCTPLQTDSPAVLDLREPRSPDSAHFSPPDDASSFSSPSSSRIRLSVSNNCPGTQSIESVATYLPSLSRPSTPDAERGEGQDEESHIEETTNPGSNVDRQVHSPAAANVSVDKRTFLGRVKRFGGRVRKLFKPRVVETKPRRGSVSSLVSPRKPPLTVNVRLPTTEPESPRSRQNLEVPSILPRRFSLQSLLHARLPTGSVNSISRNRLPTIVSAPDDDWLIPLNMHSSDAAAADVPRIGHPEAQADGDNHERKGDGSTRATTALRHGLGIETPEPISVTNRDTA